MTRKSAAALLLPALVAVACVSAPARREPDVGPPVPERWTAAPALGDGEVPDDWWTAFGDAELDALVFEALEHNNDLDAAAARVQASAALARIAGADLVPSLQFEAGGSRQKQNFVGLPIGAGDEVPSATFSSYSLGISAVWEADLWGRVRSGKAAALADLQATEALYHGARLSIAGQTAKAWFAVAEARRQLRLSLDTVEAFRDTADRVRARYERGIRPALDYRFALQNVAAAEADVEFRKDVLQQSRRRLELLLGRYPEAAVSGSDDLPPPPDQVPGGLPSMLVSRRPDLVFAERSLAASDARVAAARAALYPRLALTASGGATSDALGDLLDGDFSVWSLAAGLLQPIFQGGRLRAGVDLAEANVDEALALYVQDVLTAYAEVETLLAAEQILVREEAAVRESARQAGAARRLAEDRYDSGLEDIVTVLDSQRRALASESTLLAVRRARLDNRVDLYLALGGGFDFAGSLEDTAEEPSS